MKIIRKNGLNLGYITDKDAYVSSRKEADELAKKYNLVISNMPQLISALNIPEIRAEIRPTWADTTSAEYQGQNGEGNNIYVVAHGMGPLSTTNGIADKIFTRIGYGFMPVSSDEMKNVLKNAITLEDVRKGNIPKNQAYSIIINLDKDNPNINTTDHLSLDNFLSDDRVLAVCGSPEHRETLAKMLFDSIDNGGEGCSSVGCYHRIKDFGFNKKISGRPLHLALYLDYDYYGLSGDVNFINNGRFVLVSKEENSLVQTQK